MASRTKGGLLTCTATSSLVLLCLGLAVIAIGVIVPAQVHKKLGEGVSTYSSIPFMLLLSVLACAWAAEGMPPLRSCADISRWHLPLQIWDSVVWTSTSPHDTDGEAAST